MSYSAFKLAERGGNKNKIVTSESSRNKTSNVELWSMLEPKLTAENLIGVKDYFPYAKSDDLSNLVKTAVLCFLGRGKSRNSLRDRLQFAIVMNDFNDVYKLLFGTIGGVSSMKQWNLKR